ncbi:ferrochelatase [Aquicella lusitana]|uniref:Ferrochelatase n=1 Tax=Aquicella lusitana TaxID=254246 RepID=A0A370GKE8_9COXI|nr:ferrochelatase [Aquicella lusitana]RDI42854.1 ferrochelatase [Aquicella lusitana]VVC73097.1 Ferrochelatase [Aquicella lusitana]
MPKTGVLITNTGTPDAPTPRAVRRYLREFLSDRRIVQLPRLIWLPILYGLVLTLRPRRSARLYQRIWQENGSPMRATMQYVASSLQTKLRSLPGEIEVEIGMNYGHPSIGQGLKKLRQKNVDKIIVLPLFPQYSNTTTASTFDRVIAGLKKWSALPDLQMIYHYADNHEYICALASSVQTAWKKQGRPQHLLISFHGIPERFVKAGDPYQRQCELTAHLLAEAVGLAKDEWTLCYQSQFGYDKWLKPSTQTLFGELPERGIKHVDVICPGFAIDCLETLEEIAIRGKETFFEAGGESLRYIPALNENQIDMLITLIFSRL